jgi:MGT family glycosyltransferase
MLGAELAQVPYVALYHSGLPFPVEGAPPFGSGLPASARGTPAWVEAERGLTELSSMFDERVGSAARALGMPAYRSGLFTGLVSRDLNLLATVPALEPGLEPLTGPMKMVGPCLPRPADAEASSHPALEVLPESGLRVYVSLGTVFNGKPKVFERVLEGLESLGAHVVVSAGASYGRLKERPRGPRIHLFPQVPQVALLPRVDVVVTHGGNNTVQECLAAGRPMVVLPFGGDQVANAARVERLGVGEGLDVERLTPGRLCEAVNRVRLATRRAAVIAKALEGVDGAGVAAAAVVALVEARARAA